jgi:hypothetical protein
MTSYFKRELRELASRLKGQLAGIMLSTRHCKTSSLRNPQMRVSSVSLMLEPTAICFCLK